MSSPRRSPGLRLPAQVLLLAVVVTIDLSLVRVLDDVGSMAMWWSSVGVAMGLLARSRLRDWLWLVPAIALSGVPVALGSDLPLAQSLPPTSLHAVEAAAGALVITLAGRRLAVLDGLVSLARLTIAALVVGLLAGGVEALVRPDFVAGPGFALQMFVEHANAAMLLGAVVLTADRLVLKDPARPVTESRVWLGLLQVTALVAATWWVFVGDAAAPLDFLPVALLVTGALVAGLPVVVAQLAAFAVVVTYATSQGTGPLAATSGDVLDTDALGLVTMAYLLSATVVALPLAAAISSRRELMTSLVVDEERFRRSFSAAPVGMLLLTEEPGGALVVTDANDEALQVLRLTFPGVCNRPLDDLVDLHDAGQALHRIRHDADASWQGGASLVDHPEVRLRTALARLDARSGQWAAHLIDVSQEHAARRRLEEAHKLNDATLDTTACVILVCDGDGRIVRTNTATEEITGFGEHDLLGRHLWDTTLSALSRSETEAMFLWPNRDGQPMVREASATTAAGDHLRLVWSYNVVRDDHGFPAYAVLTGIDVTAERSSTGMMAHLMQASIATALIGVDTTGLITVFNTGASQMLGYEPSEMLGRPFVALLDPDQLTDRTGATGEHDGWVSLIGSIGDREESRTRDWTWRTKRGGDLIVAMSLSMTDDGVTERVGFLVVGRDVTEQRHGQEALVSALEKERTALERLRALDNAKDEFVSTVSHELRTPVTSILGYAEMLTDGSVVDALPEQVGMLGSIQRNGERLVAICNDLLLLSGFESRGPVMHRDTLDLRGSLGVAEDSLRGQLADRELLVTFEPGEEPCHVLGDRGQLDRVVVNLVSNAVKFTPDGGSVFVGISHDGPYAVVTVRDTGIGIPAEDVEAVFQRFYRTERAQTLAIPGTGLGLPIVASTVDAHDGRIELESELGAGTVFRVWLPRAEAPAPPRSTAPREPASTIPERRAEDDDPASSGPRHADRTTGTEARSGV